MSPVNLFHALKSFIPKCSGGIQLVPGVGRLFGPVATPLSRISEFVTLTAIADTSDHTLTVDQIAGGLITGDGGSGGRAYTLPTAALVVAAHPKMQAGHTIEFVVKNVGTTNNIAVAAGSGGAFLGTDTAQTIAHGTGAKFLLRLTNVTYGSEAYVVYTVGAFTN